MGSEMCIRDRLAFDRARPRSLYTSSYENIVRRHDVERQVLEVLALGEDERDFLPTCHLDAAANALRRGFGTVTCTSGAETGEMRRPTARKSAGKLARGWRTGLSQGW